MSRRPARAGSEASTTGRPETVRACLFHFLEGRGTRGLRNTDEIGRSGAKEILVLVHDRAESAAESGAHHGVPAASADCVRNLGMAVSASVRPAHPHRPIASRADPGECGEGRMAANSVNQAEIRARPRARRDFSTARPARFFIRRRNPCFFLRFRLFGWKVRFTHGLLKEGRMSGEVQARRAQTRKDDEGREHRFPTAPLATRGAKSRTGRPISP